MEQNAIKKRGGAHQKKLPRQKKPPKSSKAPKSSKKKLSGTAIACMFLGGILALLLAGYLIFVYANIPFVRKWRNIYIETAMTTYTHQWLATSFIPRSIIDQVMGDAKKLQEIQDDLHSTWDLPDDPEPVRPPEHGEMPGPVKPPEAGETPEQRAFYEAYWELDRDSFEKFLKERPELLKNGYEGIELVDLEGSYGLKTTMGETVCVLDAPNNILIVEVSGEGYKGKLAIAKNSDQVSLLKASKLGEQGDLLRWMAKSSGAVLAINASGFGDPNWEGNGGTVIGSLYMNGREYGNPQLDYKLFGFKKDGLFYIQNYDEESLPEYRWAIQFKPALIVDGKVYVQGSFGYGLQPRTAIGQARNLDVLLLVVDGRQVGHSIGATVEDLAEIMLRHDAWQAMNLDGGSSALMWYKGQEITKASSTTGVGRYLPDAIAVMPPKE